LDNTEALRLTPAEQLAKTGCKQDFCLFTHRISTSAAYEHLESSRTRKDAVVSLRATAVEVDVINSLGVRMEKQSKPTRRRFLLSTGLLAAGWELSDVDTVLTQALALTPSCGDGDEPTVRESEGPFFRPKSPERSDLLEPGAKGRRFELSGLVLTRSCHPLRGAVVDLWHADENGEYDNIGFRYRGHVITDPNGIFRFRTIVPALYPGRTRHYHVKVQGPGSPLLTTQLYFPNEPANRRDGLFKRELLMRVADASDGLSGQFNFVLNVR
jgi:protocatechuate 3,4-dioxygenase beta subunit